MNQQEAVIKTLEKLNGIATLKQLNDKVFEIKDCKWRTKTPFASIRRIVQLNREIYKIRPGLYGLLKYKPKLEREGIIVETEKNRNSVEITYFNHSYYQGMTASLGKLKGFDTFVPNQDKNKKFVNVPLRDIRTLDKIPQYGFPKFVSRSSTIDVIWFNNRLMPHSFFEIESSTDIQNSLLKFCDLQDFNVDMYIVADVVRKNEFEDKLEMTAFSDIKKRVKFVDYENLSKWYSNEIESTNIMSKLGSRT